MLVMAVMLVCSLLLFADFNSIATRSESVMITYRPAIADIHLEALVGKDCIIHNVSADTQWKRCYYSQICLAPAILFADAFADFCSSLHSRPLHEAFMQ